MAPGAALIRKFQNSLGDLGRQNALVELDDGGTESGITQWGEYRVWMPRACGQSGTTEELPYFIAYYARFPTYYAATL